jgi:hypothetical protein
MLLRASEPPASYLPLSRFGTQAAAGSAFIQRKYTSVIS